MMDSVEIGFVFSRGVSVIVCVGLSCWLARGGGALTVEVVVHVHDPVLEILPCIRHEDGQRVLERWHKVRVDRFCDYELPRPDCRLVRALARAIGW